ncbi:MAG TPA: hypothetical protein VJN90_12520 [Candidatus Acidoferrales bacterium]|nr:hypothetical protein [Candidatus Acidoferrales bacterium]
MKNALLLIALGVAFTASAASKPDFSGTWAFNPSKSKNIGMMASVEYTSTITQTAKLVVVQDFTAFNGQKQTHETRYDLAGTPVPNESPMGEKAQTTSHWSRNKLITAWETEGAVAGTKVVRTETRYLSPDGKTMYVESVRANKDPMVIAFDRK